MITIINDALLKSVTDEASQNVAVVCHRLSAVPLECIIKKL